MKKQIFSIFIFLFILSGCGGVGNVTNLDAQGDLIICFGDSLTLGKGANEGGDYPSILRRNLGVPVVNAGINGDTTRGALDRLQRDVLLHKPRMVIVEFGGNDFLKKYPAEETEENLKKIIERIQANGSIVCLVGIRVSILGDKFTTMFETLVDDYGCIYIPNVLKGILSNPKLKHDQIHPNTEGYKLVAERILGKLKPALEKANKKRNK